MAIEGLQSILEAQQKQRDKLQDSESDGPDNNEVISILKLIFEYMKKNDSYIMDVVNSLADSHKEVKNQLEEINKKLDK